jgi:flagellar biosynthesis component FlhA
VTISTRVPPELVGGGVNDAGTSTRSMLVLVVLATVLIIVIILYVPSRFVLDFWLTCNLDHPILVTP